VACQGGTVAYPSLCHAKADLGDSLTDCLLVDAALVANPNPNGSGRHNGAGAASSASAAAAAMPAAATTAAGPVDLIIPGGSEGCSDRTGDAQGDDDDATLVLCDGDMLFAGWCDAYRHHFTKEQCEEY
jgi:hypothetical protein